MILFAEIFRTYRCTAWQIEPFGQPGVGSGRWSACQSAPDLAAGHCLLIMGITSLLICSLVILVGASLAGAWGDGKGTPLRGDTYDNPGGACQPFVMAFAKALACAWRRSIALSGCARTVMYRV